MRINKYLAQATGLSRRASDQAIADGRVRINNQLAKIGQAVKPEDTVSLDERIITPSVKSITIMLNKPVGYVCSRNGQGNKTIYELLPKEYHHLKPVGRLDKNSSGLLLLSNDGQLTQKLTHPSFQKTKVYKIALNKPLTPEDRAKVEAGITLEDGPSKLQLERINSTDNTNWKVIMREGRNRQIRRTFLALGYSLPKLHRTQFGPYTLNSLTSGKFDQIKI